MKRQEETRAGGRHCPWGGHRNPEPSLGREKTEADLAHREACDIESGDRLDKAHSVLPAPADRAHVRDIKETGLLTDLRAREWFFVLVSPCGQGYARISTGFAVQCVGFGEKGGHACFVLSMIDWA
jgi:hypothetical protein